MQVHGRAQDAAVAGQRAAINLSGVEVQDLSRGQALVTPDSFEETRIADAIVQVLADAKPLKHGTRVRFLTINDRLADPEGKLFDGVLNERDKLHPTIKGYQIWADALKPIFRELLGPPGTIDLAPPPTGDPSAARRPQ